MIAETHRRDILDTLIQVRRPSGRSCATFSTSSLRCQRTSGALSEVGLVRVPRSIGRRRLYRLEAAHLRPVNEWLAKYEQAVIERLDRLDDYLQELRQQGDLSDT